MLDVVNLAVGSLAIILSIISSVVSLVYSAKASATLETVKAEIIEKDVRDRLDDLVKRAAPSEQERALASIMPDLMKNDFCDPKLTKLFLEEKSKEQP